MPKFLNKLFNIKTELESKPDSELESKSKYKRSLYLI